MHRVINTAHSRANFILRAFSYCSSFTHFKLFCTFVRTLPEYCSQIWSPWTLEKTEMNKCVQNSFTRRLPWLSFLSYSERLINIMLHSLKLKRLRVDLTSMYNILHNNLYTFSNFFILSSYIFYLLLICEIIIWVSLFPTLILMFLNMHVSIKLQCYGMFYMTT